MGRVFISTRRGSPNGLPRSRRTNSMSLSKPKSSVKIGEAAKALGVSTKTLRRWEAAGKITSTRTPGGTRVYSLEQLQSLNPSELKYQQAQPQEDKLISISEAAQKLGVSTRTLRRWNEQGKIASSKLPTGRLVYQQEALQQSVQTITNPIISPASSVASNPELTGAKKPFLKLSQLKFVSTAVFTMGLGLIITTAVLAALNLVTSPQKINALLESNPISSALQPVNKLALQTASLISPELAKELEDPPPIINHQASITDPNVLAVTASSSYLELNSDTQINGTLSVRDSINGVIFEGTPSAQTFIVSAGNTTLTVSNTASLDQDVSTTSSPTFAGLTSPTLNLSGTTNQLVFQSGGVSGTVTWTPTGTAKIITLPDATTTLVGTDTTQTLTNKTISGSSNTFSNIPNSALSNSKVTVTAGTNLAGGGDVQLGSSVTLNLKDSIDLSGTLDVDGATTLASTLTVSGASVLSSTLAVTGATTLSSTSLSIGGVAYTFPSSQGVADTYLTNNGSGTLTWSTISTAGGWTDSGSAIYQTNLSDNVGIGTSTPGYRFEVSGNSYFSGFVGIGSSLNIAGNVGVGGSLNVTSLSTFSGQILGANGSASAPQYSFTNSPSTGLWSPSANALSLTTNGSDTSGITITQAGRIGIGTTAPATPVHWYSSTLEGSWALETSVATAGESALDFRKSRSDGIITSGDRLGEFRFFGHDGTDFVQGARILTTTESGISTGIVPTRISMSTMDSSGTTATRFVIGSGGNVGIGATTTPGSLLDVNSTTGGVITASRTDTSITANDSIGKLQFYGIDTSLSTQRVFADIEAFSTSTVTTDAAAGYLVFRTTGTTAGGSPQERMRITETGNVGIGTSSPGTALAVNGGGLFGYSGIDNLSTGTSLVAEGNVGIGTTSPIAKLNILNTSNSNALRLISQTTGAAGAAHLELDNPAAFGPVLFVRQKGTGDFVQFTNGTAVVAHINNSGNLGVGVTTAGSKLSIGGNAVIGWGVGSVAGPTNGLAVQGNVGIGTTTVNYNLSVIGTANFTGNVGVGASLTVGGLIVGSGGVSSTDRITTSAFTLTTGGTSNAVLVSDASGNASWSTTIVGSLISADSLDFDKFADSMTLDASTDIATAGFNLTTSGSGAVSFNNTGGFTVANAATFSSTINTNTFNSTTLLFSGSSNVSIGASVASTTLSINPGAGGRIDFAGGSGSSGCTLEDSTGVFTCSGGIGVGASGGSSGFWSRNESTTTLSPAFSGDHITTSGNITTSGSGVITSSGTLTAQNGLTQTTGALNLTSSSGTAALTLSLGVNAFTVNGSTFGIDTFNNRVGIGTSTPNSKLHIQSTSTDTSLLSFIGSSAGQFSILNNGNVGIGNSAPQELFVVGSGTDASGYSAANLIVTNAGSSALAVRDSTNDVEGNIFVGSSGVQFITSTNHTVALGTGDRNRLRIDTSGNIGIGLTPGTTNGSRLAVDGNAVFGWGSTTIAGPTNGLGIAGNVGIGTTSPAQALHVAGNGYFSGNLGIGFSSPTVSLDVYGGDSTSGNANFRTFSDSQSDVFQLNTYRSRGTAVNQTAVASSDRIMSLIGRAFDGSAYRQTTIIQARVDTFTDVNDISGSLHFFTRASGVGGATTERLRIGGNGDISMLKTGGTVASVFQYSSGNVGIGDSAPAGPLAQLHLVQTDSADAFRVDDSASDTTPFIIDATGNIGVGFTSPTAITHILNTGSGRSFRVDDDTNDATPFVIDPAGNVGVSTNNFSNINTTAAQQLMLDTDDRILVISNSSGSALNLENTLDLDSANIGTRIGAVTFSNTEGQADAHQQLTGMASYITGVSESGGTPYTYRADLRFYTKGAAGPIERLRITDTGNVGIGTSPAPVARLHLSGVGASTGKVFLTQNSTQTNFGLAVEDGGNVGIGLTNPSSYLMVIGDNTNDDQIIFASTLTNNTAKFGTIGGVQYDNGTESEGFTLLNYNTSSTANQLAFGGNLSTKNAATSLEFYTAANNSTRTGTQRMIIDSGGNVGIGFSTPSFKFQVNSGTNTTFINSSGNLGVGATTSANKLDVWGNARITGSLTVDGAQTFSGALSIADGTAATPGLNFINDTDTGLWRNTTNMVSLTTNGAGSLQSGRTINGLSVNSTGNVGIGTTNPSQVLQVGSSYTNIPAPSGKNIAIIDGDYTVAGDAGLLLSSGRGNNTLISMWRMATATVGSGISLENELTFSTVAQASNTPVERIRFDKNGNIGIGTTAADVPLSVVGIIRTGANSSTATIQFNDSSTVIRRSGSAIDIIASTLSIPDGSATTPGVSFLNDADTGLWRIGTNQIGLTTAGNAHSGLSINSAGNVGIGTTSAGAKLNIVSAGEAAQVRLNDTTSGGALAFFLGSTNQSYIGINSSQDTYISTVNQDHAEVVLDFISGGSNVRITPKGTGYFSVHSGNVGIGTTAPLSKLHIGTGSSVGLRIDQASNNNFLLAYSGGGTTLSHNLFSDGSGHSAYYMYNGSGTVTNAFNTSGSSYINGGNVGIGFTSPAAKLQINDTYSSSTPVLRVYHNDATEYMLNFDSYVVGAGDVGYKFTTNNGPATATALALSGYGNVGIGTSSPATTLHISKPITPIIRLDGTGGRTLEIRTGDLGSQNPFIGTTYSADLYLGANSSTTQIVLDGGSNNVGIGTASPLAKMQINAPSGYTGPYTRFAADSEPTAYYLELMSSDRPGIVPFWFRQNNGSTFYDQVLSFDRGNVGIGTTTPSAKFQVAGTSSNSHFMGTATIGTASYPGFGNLTFEGAQNPSIELNDDSANRFGMRQTSAQLQIYAGNGLANYSVRFGTNNGGTFTPKMTFDTTNGNLGIGWTSPLGRLHIADIADGGNIILDSATGLQGAGQDLGILFRSASAQDAGKIQAMTTATNVVDLAFHTLSGTITEKMRITGAGNVGVGTTGPSQKLEVKGVTRITRSDGANYTEIGTEVGLGELTFVNPGSSTYNQFAFSQQNNGSKRYILWTDTSGNVGIGTTGPSSKLHVVGDIRAERVGVPSQYIYMESGGGTGFLKTANEPIGFAPGGTERVTILTDGNLGIGTASPNMPLSVAANSSGDAISIWGRNNGVIDEAALYFRHNDGITSHGSIIGESSSLRLSSNSGSNALVIAQGGNVGIGFTSPRYLLSVNNPNNSNSSTVGLKASNTEPVLALFGSTGNKALYAGYETSGDHGWLFAYDRGASTGKNLVINQYGGNVGIGTATTYTLFTVAGDVSLTNNGAYRIRNAANNANLNLAYMDTSNLQQIGDSASAGLRLYSGSSSPTMSLTTGGNVGIGTTGPLNALEVVRNDTSVEIDVKTNLSNGSASFCTITGGGANNQICSTTFAGSTTGTLLGILRANNGFLYTQGTTTGMALGTTGAHPLYLSTNNSTQMTILSGGNVGIGTTAPSLKAHILSNVSNIGPMSTSTTAQLKISNPINVTGNYSLINFSFPENDINALIGARLANSGNGGSDLVFAARSGGSILGEAMTLTGAGNLGVGVTGPSFRGQFATSTSGIAHPLAITNTNGSANDSVALSFTHKNSTGALDNYFARIRSVATVLSAGSETGDLAFDTTATGVSNERVRITSSGNVGIGSSNPGTKLYVVSDTTDRNVGQLRLGTANSASHVLTMGMLNTSTPHATLQTIVSGAAGGNFAMQAAGGNVGIGFSSPSNILHVRISGSSDEVRIDKAVDWVGSGFTQLRLSDFNNPNKMLRIGYSSTGDFGVIQSQESGIGQKILTLNPNGGNVGIGITTPNATLSVVTASTVQSIGAASNSAFHFGNESMTTGQSLGYFITDDAGATDEYLWAGYNDFDGTPNLVVKCRTDGTCQTDGTWATGGADYAEYVLPKTGTTPLDYPKGSIICIITTDPDTYGLCDFANNQKLAGVVSTNPGILGNSPALDDLTETSREQTHIALAMLGRVPTRVSTENGDIEIGDYLTSSSIPGVAMKATKPGVSIGRALESYSGSGEGSILIYLNVSFADPGNFLASLSLDDQGNLIAPKIKTDKLLLTDGNIGLGTTDPNSLLSYEFSSTPSGSVDVSVNVLDSLKRLNQELLDVKSRVATNSADIAGIQTNTATQSAQVDDLAAQLASAAAELSQTKSRVDTLELTPPDTLFATGSAALHDITVSEATVSGMLASYDLTVSNIFKSLGTTLLASTNIAGDLSVDGTLSIENGSEINVLGTLYLQKSIFGENLDIFNGKVLIDKNGNITSEGIISAPQIKTNKLTISNDPIATSSATLGASIGTSTIPAGQTSITISSEQITANSKVFITAHKPVSISVSSKDTTNKTFTVELAGPQAQTITFDWWIVGTE